MPWRARTLWQLLVELAQRHPAATYLVSDQQRWTYADLADWAERLAAALRGSGVAAGSRVAIALPNGPGRVAVEFAVAAAGATSVQLSERLSRHEVSDLLNRTRTMLLVDEMRMAELDAAARRASRRTGFHLQDPGQATVIFPAAHESGRTALVRLTHDQLLRSAFGSAYTRAFEEGRTILFALPLSHVFAYVEGMLAALFCAGAIVPQGTFRTETTFAAIERQRATDALFVPAMTLALLRRGARGFDVSSLTAVMSAGTRAPAGIWSALREQLGVSNLTNGYGQTETAASSTLTAPDASDDDLDRTVGRPKAWPAEPLVEYRAIDPRTGEARPEGEEGELVVRGPTVAQAYDGDDDLTARAIRDGWLRSGDLGRVRPDGSLELTGRVKLLLRTGGENVAPREVEAVLAVHPDVARACIVGVPNARLGEVVTAWVVPRPGASVEPDALRAFCRERLASYKVPRHFLEIGSLPVDQAGEPQRVRLRDLAAAELA